MEAVIPPLLQAVQELRWQIASGLSMKEAFNNYLASCNNPLAAALRERWTLKWQSRSAAPSAPFTSAYQSALWELVERGCTGHPVLEPLTALEEEVERAAQAEMDQHVADLPFKVLLPLLLFQFPAHMILLLGPMLRDLSQQLGA